MLKVIVPLAAVLVAGGTLAMLPAQPPAVSPSAAPAQAQPAAQTTPADPVAAAPRISVAEAKKALDAGKAILVDVRSSMSYDQEHAKGSISLPLYDLPSRAAELPKDKQIIAYCT
ncbi:MAG: rhodanese-like domain-containing protein [Thermoanaerobaculia bacterium]